MRRFFSLIELLIVIAIIAILASMLLPALNNARDRARSVRCMNTAKQLGMYFALYTQNYDGWIPACTQPGADGKPNWTRALFTGFRSITRNDFICSAVQISPYGTGNYWFRVDQDWQSNTYSVDWAYNINFVGYDELKGIKEGKIYRPAYKIFLLESSASVTEEHGYFRISFTNGVPQDGYGIPASRHGHINNSLCGDGHVEAFRLQANILSWNQAPFQWEWNTTDNRLYGPREL